MRVDVIGTRGFPLVEGGVEKHCEALYPRMASSCEITVYRRRPYVKTGGSYQGVNFRDLPSTRVKGFETVLHSFLATCCVVGRKPDVVHYHNIGPALFSPLLRLRSIPMVLTYHSPNYEHAKWGGFARRLLLHSEKVALREAARVIFVNKFQMERFSGQVLAKSVYIPNGIDEPTRSKNTDKLDELGLAPEKFILSVGRITPEKGFDTLIKAFAEAGIPDCKLAIVGGVESEAGYMSELRQLAEGVPVVFAGQLHGDDLSQMYQNARLFVLASRNEGFPLALLEAMSYGLDVLVSDMSATHLVDLEPGDYCPIGSVGAVAHGIKSKLANRRVRTYALEQFDWNRIAVETKDTLASACRCNVKPRTDLSKMGDV